jgi:thiamine-phosphate pyrophosphorylase
LVSSFKHARSSSFEQKDIRFYFLSSFRLHILTDTVLQNRWSHAALAEMALEGGADVIQYRHKGFQIASHENDMARILALKARYNFHFLLNDFAEEAALLGLDGCHVGKEDTPPGQARQYFEKSGRSDAVIGATVHSLEELEAIKNEAIDYIGVGPVFGTQSKETGLPALGLEKLAEICRYSPFPVIGIGNITPASVPALLQAGVHGVAVLGAVCLAPDPKEAVRSFAHYFH